MEVSNPTGSLLSIQFVSTTHMTYLRNDFIWKKVMVRYADVGYSSALLSPSVGLYCNYSKVKTTLNFIKHRQFTKLVLYSIFVDFSQSHKQPIFCQLNVDNGGFVFLCWYDRGSTVVNLKSLFNSNYLHVKQV